MFRHHLGGTCPSKPRKCTSNNYECLIFETVDTVKKRERLTLSANRATLMSWQVISTCLMFFTQFPASQKRQKQQERKQTMSITQSLVFLRFYTGGGCHCTSIKTMSNITQNGWSGYHLTSCKQNLLLLLVSDGCQACQMYASRKSSQPPQIGLVDISRGRGSLRTKTQNFQRDGTRVFKPKKNLQGKGTWVFFGTALKIIQKIIFLL